MNTEIVKLSQVRVNEANPSTITNEKFQKLVNSVLALPKMLELRPIVVDNMMVALGGNMRFRALTAISDLSEDELKSRLFSINDVAVLYFSMSFMKPTEEVCRPPVHTPPSTSRAILCSGMA